MYKEILCNFENIREAYQKAHRQKTNSAGVIEFDNDKIYNLNKLKKKLENKEWDKIFVYYRFTITSPKERIVDALRFEGRIVQHILCDKILKPYFENRLVYANSACRENKGTDFAINLLRQYLVEYYKTHQDGYVLKMDVKKYFPSIDRDVLKMLLKKFPDAEIRELLYYIIDTAPDGNGIPIGNQTSQWFALYYLDLVDRTIKEKFRIKYYVRYMDDLVIIHEDKKYLTLLLNQLTTKTKQQLHLEFNGKTQIFPLHKGISFLGWKLYYRDAIIMKIDSNKRKIRNKRIREIYKIYEKKKITKENLLIRLFSMEVYLSKGNAYAFRKNIYRRIK